MVVMDDDGRVTLTSIQASSLSSLDLLLPLTACRLLGGAISSEPFRAGLLRSSILTTAERGAVVGEVDRGIRNEVCCGELWWRLISGRDS